MLYVACCLYPVLQIVVQLPASLVLTQSAQLESKCRLGLIPVGLVLFDFQGGWRVERRVNAMGWDAPNLACGGPVPVLSIFMFRFH